MSAPYVTRPATSRQLEALHRNLEIADRNYMAHFETSAAKLWGIDEHVYEPDVREGTIHADLTLIISLKDRRNRLSQDEIKVVARRELHNLVNNKGEWSKGLYFESSQKSGQPGASVPVDLVCTLVANSVKASVYKALQGL